MKIFRLFYETILDAIFPKDKYELEVLSLPKEEAFAVLPKAPEYNPKEDFQNMYSVFSYKDEKVKKLIWALKYKESKQAADICAFVLAKKIEGTINTNTNNILILPMPIAEKRRRERGYNQCEIMLDEMKVYKQNKNLLKRIQYLKRQTDKDKAERQESAKNLFEIDIEEFSKLQDEYREGLANIQIIIVDDVITTGSTMKEAMKVLRDVGFKNVIGISIAH